MFRARAAAGFPLELGLLCRLPRSYRYLSTAATPSSPSSSFLDFDQLPCFPVRGRDLKVLYEPQDFYSTLLKGIKKAKKRIFLASLYIGKEETELVRALPLWQGSQTLKVDVYRYKLYIPPYKRMTNSKSISSQTIYAQHANTQTAHRVLRL